MLRLLPQTHRAAGVFCWFRPHMVGQIMAWSSCRVYLRCVQVPYVKKNHSLCEPDVAYQLKHFVLINAAWASALSYLEE